MTLTPAQVADLRAPDRVRGVVAGVIVYTISASLNTIQRLQELSSIGSTPPALTWYVVGFTSARAELHASLPEWIAELEMRIEDAKRPAR